ncbi:MAG: hypothetical protein BLM47_04050 [Candidatus Reconcilbacillus cellulovorans]|uniref:GAF domain-containing protein n=1 Tax=Candidatus Reconcilbacillus cellulovorans TaxID=1906605 RepID=A0A2A6E1V8_9BACL|nr:MAG: hypothetical protein BLM47_04050 [Candidatus Reconcilbacillus cellulovorans]
MDALKERQLMDKIESHLRKTARRMVQFDSLDETVQYLIDSFCNQFPCDYVAICLKNEGTLAPVAVRGKAERLDGQFPIAIDRVLPRVLEEPLCSFDAVDGKERCAFLSRLEEEKFQTWFTVPIRSENDADLGLCVIGFRTFVPLVLEAGKLFEEYGKDIATALTLVRRKEQELNKIRGLEWLKENVYVGGASLEQIVANAVERAGRGTNAKAVFLYLYDERTNCLVLHPPVFGENDAPERIDLKDEYDLRAFFPYLEKPGGRETTIPLMVNLKMIGVLHAVARDGAAFAKDQLDFLQFISSYVSALIENAKLYRDEREGKERLEQLMARQQELVKQTVENEGFDNIAGMLSRMLGAPVWLFDRFFHLLFCHGADDGIRRSVVQAVVGQRRRLREGLQTEYWLAVDGNGEIGVFRITAGPDTLGYLAILLPKDRLDVVLRMTVHHALNVFAVQFIKQRLVLDVREQVKDSFFSQWLEGGRTAGDEILRYAHLFDWDVSQPHVVGALAFEPAGGPDGEGDNLFEIEEARNRIWDRLRDYLRRREPGVLLTRKDANFVVIVPADRAKESFRDKFCDRAERFAREELTGFRVYLGVSQEARRIEDYPLCYRQAHQTLALLRNRFRERRHMAFDELGAYAVLYRLDDPGLASLFIKSYLDPLLNYGKGKSTDLFETLRVYLQTNGNIKETAERLFIHRSSLKYRLEKIREVLDRDIDDAEQRFNLMLAYKLHDLFGDGP